MQNTYIQAFSKMILPNIFTKMYHRSIIDVSLTVTREYAQKLARKLGTHCPFVGHPLPAVCSLTDHGLFIVCPSLVHRWTSGCFNKGTSVGLTFSDLPKLFYDTFYDTSMILLATFQQKYHSHIILYINHLQRIFPQK